MDPMAIGILQVGSYHRMSLLRFLDLPCHVTVAQQPLKLQRCCGNSLGSSERATASITLDNRYDVQHALLSQLGARKLQPEE